MNNKAFVIGSINQDIVANVVQHPKIGETVLGNKLEYHPGGKGANQAIACAKLGGDVSMLGNVGSDDAGNRLIKYLGEQGVDSNLIEIIDGQPTGTALITVNSKSENSIVVVLGANEEWGGRPDSSNAFSKNDVVMAQFEVPLEVVQQYFHKAKAVGAKTILNPSPIQDISEELFHLVDYLVVNEIELAQIAKVTIDPKDDEIIFMAAEKIGKRFKGILVVTLGGGGVRIMDNGKRQRINARVVTPVDTTGAGDCFVGGLAAGLLQGKNIFEAADLGNQAAAISVTKPGAASSMPSITEIYQKYGNQNGG